LVLFTTVNVSKTGIEEILNKMHVLGAFTRVNMYDVLALGVFVY